MPFYKGHPQYNTGRTHFKKGHIPWMEGKHHSEESKKKMSEARKGRKLSKKWRRKLSEAKKGKKPKNFWMLHTPEGIKKASESRKGDRNPSWRGGKSFEPYGLEFNKKLKEQIRKRDNYRCQECFRHQDELYDKKGRKYKLIVHHIDYNKQNNKENNLISLCRNCHLKTNFDREDWIKYFKRLT